MTIMNGALRQGMSTSMQTSTHTLNVIAKVRPGQLLEFRFNKSFGTTGGVADPAREVPGCTESLPYLVAAPNRGTWEQWNRKVA
jgi:hypothetical protein